ncbi:hypothetical protein [Streptomyces sp. NPDC001876]|uniref:hypothetical protein n=1 Tax=Streptomyces sp. NPDC001876 TaxID=3154402 RepID=UPI0033165D26
MQEGQHSEEGLVGVGVGGGGPAAEQLALLVDGDGGAAEPGRACRLQTAGGVDEDDFARAGEAEVLPQYGQSALAGLGPGGQERFDVVDVGQGRLDGDVGVRQGPGAQARSRARSIASENAWIWGRSGSGAASMRRRRRPAASWSAWLVGSARARWVKKSSSARAREPIERPGRRAVFVLQEPTESADHGAGPAGAVPGGEVAGEVAQPRRWVGEAFLQVGGGDERPVGVLLPAG